MNAFIWLIVLFASMYNLGPRDQVLYHTRKGKEVTNGPGFLVANPFAYHQQREAIKLSQTQYAVIKNTEDGEIHHVAGPATYFMGAWEELEEKKNLQSLRNHEYMRLVDRRTGVERVISGPISFKPEPLEEAAQGKEVGISLSRGKSLVTFNRSSGVKRLVTQEGYFFPQPYEDVIEQRNPVVVGPNDYAKLRDERTGAVRHVEGSVTLQVGAYETLIGVYPKTVVQNREFIRYVDQELGTERVVSGPVTIVPGATEIAETGVEHGVTITSTTGVLLEDIVLGEKILITTLGVFTPNAYQYILETRTARVIGQNDYGIVRNLTDGVIRHEQGPQQFFLDPYEELVGVQRKIVLQNNEYIRYVDNLQGTERVLVGPQTFIPGPYEEAPDGLQQAIFIDTDAALLVLNRQSGQRRLVDTSGLFTPAAYEVILEVQYLIRVSPHEAVIIRSFDGSLTVESGSGGSGGRSFFLQPYSEMIPMTWSDFSWDGSTGQPKTVDRIDLRLLKVFFEYYVRTSDNVLLALTGTVFWQIANVALMVSATADPEGDVWYHSRSALLKAISAVTLETFMADANNITMVAFNEQAHHTFYSDRGLIVESMEFTGYSTVDEETTQILQLINQENTNRINLLNEQELNADLAMQSLNAEILREESETDLLNTQKANIEAEARTDGQAEGEEQLKEVQTYLDGLSGTVLDVADRITLYKEQEENRRQIIDTENYAKMHLYLSPEETSYRLDLHSHTEL